MKKLSSCFQTVKKAIFNHYRVQGHYTIKGMLLLNRILKQIYFLKTVLIHLVEGVSNKMYHLETIAKMLSLKSK